MRKSLYRRHNQVFLGLLRRYREQGKFRQRDLAEHIGSVQATVSKAETGNRRLDVIELREWLMAMGVDFLEFMTELHEQLDALSHQLDSWFLHPSARTAAEAVAHNADLSEAHKTTGAHGAAQEQFQTQVGLLARSLVPVMRAGLSREVIETFTDLDREHNQTRLLARWVAKLGAKEAVALMQPAENEVTAQAQEMAQLLMSNWIGLLARREPEEAFHLLQLVKSGSPELAHELVAGCLAWPISEAEAKSILVSHLSEHWTEEMSAQWPQTRWVDRSSQD